MRDVCWGERPEKEGQLEELVDDQNPSPEAPPRNKMGRDKMEKRGVMEKSRYARVIEEVRRDDPTEYFLSMGIGSTF